MGNGSVGGFRPATPNRRGQYSDAVLNELESQNDGQVEGIMGKVRLLKDVGFPSYTSISRLWRMEDGVLPLYLRREENKRMMLMSTLNR